MGAYLKFVDVLLSQTKLTEFERGVLRTVSRVPLGRTITYGELALRMDKARAGRAVGNALHKNPFPVIIPCHRVVASNDIGGYGHGVRVKRALLTIEYTLVGDRLPYV